MFESVCSFPLTSDLFAQAIHPSEPIIAAGLASGHVQALRLPSTLAHGSSTDSASSGDSNGTRSSTGQGTIDTLWRTRRHKGSCRSLAFTTDGQQLVSAGSDGIVKIARTETGQVASKILVPAERGEMVGSPALLHVLSPETLILATDTSAVHLYDIRVDAGSKGRRPQQTQHPHDDYVSSLTSLPPTEASTSGYSKQWVTTGGTTLAVTDIRRGVLVKSEDQEDELLSSTVIRGLPRRGTSVGEKVVVGGAGGVVTLWERGVWDDQDERITVDSGRGGGESLDVLATVPKDVGSGREVLIGMGDGRIKVIKIGPNRVVAELRHDEVEGVIALGFDAEGRAISGGGQILKVWQETWEDGGSDTEVNGKRSRDSDDDDDDDGSSDDDSDEPESKPESKKQKRGNGPQDGRGEHGVLAFKGLD